MNYGVTIPTFGKFRTDQWEYYNTAKFAWRVRYGDSWFWNLRNGAGSRTRNPWYVTGMVT